jgi:RNA polymerase sigma-70 factor (ECF subfamily)
LEAFEELVFRYEGRIYAFLLNSCGSEYDARDLAQETFVRAFQAISKFNPRLPFGPWLFTIARRKRLDRARGRRHLPIDDSTPEVPDNDDPAELLCREEQRRNIWALARAVLSEAQFDALWMRYVEGMNTAEISSVVRKTQTHVKVLLFRARKTLSAEFQSADRIIDLGPFKSLPSRHKQLDARPALPAGTPCNAIHLSPI